MFCKAKKHRQRIAACGSEMGTFGNHDAVETEGSGTATLTSEDMRAIVTLALLLASILGLTVPYVLFYALSGIIYIRPGSPASLIAILIIDLYQLVRPCCLEEQRCQGARHDFMQEDLQDFR